MFKRNLAVLGIVAGVMLGSLGLTAFATDNLQIMAATGVAGEALDAALYERVSTLLRTDLGLVGERFHIKARSGVVTLAGTVSNEHSLHRALDLASGISGVREVHNALEINSPK